MSYRDQEKFLEIIKKHERNLTPKECEEYKMFMKMHKDEEDFDTVSLRRLQELYEKYNVPVDKSKYDKFFKK